MPRAVIVVRVDVGDVAATRRALHKMPHPVSDVVFKERPSIHNHGIELYELLSDEMDELFARARQAMREVE